MQIRKVLLILLLSEILVACQIGSQSSNGIQTKSLQSEPKLKELLKIRPLQLAALPGAQDLTAPSFGYKDIKLGSGYDPATGEVYHTSEPDLAKFQYLADGSVVQSAIDGCRGNEFFVRAKEIGDILSSSSQELFKADLGAAAGFGLYKMKMAAAYDQTKINAEGTASITREAAGIVSCDIYIKSQGAGKSATISDYISQAFMAGSPEISQLIKRIRAAKSARAKNEAIAEFYATFGPYVVTNVTLGEIAATGITMTQKISTEEQIKKGSFAMDFSAPFVNGNVGIDFANGSKISSSHWNIASYQYEFPEGTRLKESIKNAVADIEEFKKNGILDYGKLTPEPVKVEQITRPDLSTITSDQSVIQKLQQVNKGYALAQSQINLINSELQNLSPAAMVKDNLTYINQLITDYFTQLGEIEDTYLTKSQASAYTIWLSNKASLMGVNTLIKTVVDSCDGLESCSAQDLLAAKIKAYLNAVGIAQAAADNDKGISDKLTKQNKEFITKYPTIEAYIRTAVYLAGRDGAEKDPFNQDPRNFDAWYTHLSLDNPGKIVEYKEEYKKQLGIDTESQSLLQLRQQVVQVLHKDRQNSTKALTVQADDADIYKNKLVTNFSLTAWANIFPELNYQFITDDSEEVNQHIVQTTLNRYFKMYRYLADVAAVDPLSNELFAKEAGANGIYNKLAIIKNAVDAVVAQVPSADNQKVVFEYSNQEKFSYDLFDDIEVSQLLKQISRLEESSAMLNSEWGKATQLLMDKDLIGRYGSLAGIQPIALGQELLGFRLLTNSTTSLPLPEDIAKAAASDWKKLSPLRMVLQIFSNALHKPEQALPRGIYMTTRNQMHAVNGVPQDEIFKNKMIGMNGAKGSVVPIGFFDDIGVDAEYPVNGIVPIVLASTRIEGTKIKKIGIIDSLGHIWGINANYDSNRDKFSGQENTLTYDIDLSQNIATNSTFPAYRLTPSAGNFPPIMEFRWNLMGYDKDNTELFNLFVGLSQVDAMNFASQNLQSLNKDIDFTQLKGKLVYNSYEDQDPAAKMFSIYTSGGVYLPALTSASLGFSSCYADGQSDANWLFNNNVRAVWAPFPNMNICTLQYYSPRMAVDNHGNALGIKNITQYNLIIAPITKDVIYSIANSLRNDQHHKPLLPTYSFVSN